MKLTFQAGRVYSANKIERGDKHDLSIVHLLSTLPGEAFLVEKKDVVWEVTTGQVVTDAPVKADIPVPASKLLKTVIAKIKPKKPKKKKG